MEFKTAIRSFFANYATFSGRARRSEYWWVQLFLVLTVIVTSILDSALFGVEFGGFGLFGTLTTLGTLVPALAVTWRRLHDIGKSGGFFFLALIPLVGIVILIVWLVRDSDPKKNMFGPNPKSQPQAKVDGKPATKTSTPVQTSKFIWGPTGKSNPPRILLISGIAISLIALIQIVSINIEIDNLGFGNLDAGQLCSLSNILSDSIFERECPPTRREELEQGFAVWGLLLVVGLGLVAASFIMSRRGLSVASSPKSNTKITLSAGVTREPSEPSLKKCPMCAEDIKIEAKLCKHCGTKLDK
jgi:uncharacterized membrane protein YhaH (DUF805 family)